MAGMYFSPNFATMVQKVWEVREAREVRDVRKVWEVGEVQKVWKVQEGREFWEVILASSGCTISQTGAVPFRGRR